jgi:hypothetical protein
MNSDKLNRNLGYCFNYPDSARAVELPLAFRYIDLVAGELVEVGAVTPYYIESTHTCIDPTDKKSNTKAFAQDYDFKSQNVLCISTVEHIGKGEYGLPRQKGLAFEVLNKIFEESKSCLISWPIGYNKALDKDFRDSPIESYFFYVKTSRDPLSWELVNSDDGFAYCFNSPFRRANSVIFVTK